MNFAVIIPSKTASNLEACAWGRLDLDPDCGPLIVVDDGLAYIPDSCEGAMFIKGVKPFVFASNINLGITEAMGRPNIEGVVLLNDDAVLNTPRGFSVLARAAKDHPEYGIIASTCNNVGNLAQRPQGIGLREEMRMVCFVAVYIPRTTIETVGVLDSRFSGYGLDDDDFCLRVRKSGLKIGIHDGCYVDHGSLRSTYRGDPQAPADYRPNLELFKQKWGTDNFGNPA